MTSDYQKHELHRAYAQEIMKFPGIIDTRRRAFLCHVFLLALYVDSADLFDEHFESLRKQLQSIEDNAQNTLYEFYEMAVKDK